MAETRTHAGADEFRAVVLLGAGRGGTTLLYKLLALHRDVGYLSNYQQRFPRWSGLAMLHRLIRDRHELKLRAWFKADGGAYFGDKRDRLSALVPVPLEGEPVYAVSGIPRHVASGQTPNHEACDRLRRAFCAIQQGSAARLMLTKRTANNRRVAWMEAAFQAPLYVHLVRDGRAVARSLLEVAWWPGHTLFWSGRTPAQMVADGADEYALAARNWTEEMQQISAGLESVPPERIHTLRYEELLSAPEQTLARILAFAGIRSDDDPQFEPAVSRLGLRPRAADWDRGLASQTRDTIVAIQHAELCRWGYAL